MHLTKCASGLLFFLIKVPMYLDDTLYIVKNAFESVSIFEFHTFCNIDLQ